jgi:hypothetical protein
MSTISQTIPTLLGGVSQQPDNRKRPGQVKEATNTFPDFALGMLKRPGGKFISKLYDAAASDSKWFPILQTGETKFIAQYDTSGDAVRVWSIIDGTVRAVENPNQAFNVDIADLRTKAVNWGNAIEAVSDEKGTLQAVEKSLAERIDGVSPSIAKYLEVSNTYAVGNLDENLVSGVLVDSAGTETFKKDGSIVTGTQYSKGTERTNDHPVLASQGYRIYELEETTAAQYTDADVTAFETNQYATAKGAYDTDVTTEGTSQTAYDTALGTISGPTAYLAGTEPDDLEFFTLNDFTFVLNKKKEVAMETDTMHGSIPQYRAFVVINVVASGTYKVTLTTDNGDTVGSHSASSNDTGAHIADQINVHTSSGVTGIDGVDGFTAEVIGPGLYITNIIPFTITTEGPSQSESIYAFTDEIQNISRLPAQAKNGYVVKVVNSSDIDIDDMYVKFVGTNGDGTGTWEETTAPGVTYKFDPDTMPHRIRRVVQTNGDEHFVLEPFPDNTPTAVLPWNNRLVGDDTTNPIPSFVGNTISQMFFYRNRLGFVSGENIILSKAGDIFNFWNTTAQTATDDDPIDISAAGKRPVYLNYVEPTSVGLVLYSDTEQFILSTDSDILSPKTAKVNSLSSYESDKKIQAVSLGTSQAFISKTPLYTRLFELNDISTEQPPLMQDITNVVPEYIPNDIDSMIASPGLSLVSLGKTGSSTLYQYRFLQQNRERRIVNCWYKWELNGTLLCQFFDANTLYAVTQVGNDVCLESFDMNQSNESGFLTLPTGEKTDVCLDLFQVNPHRTYDSATDKTKIELPYDHIAGKKLTVLALGGYIGSDLSLSSSSVGAVLRLTVTPGTPDYVEFDGDYRGRNLIIGYNYDMALELPKLYPYRVENNDIKNDDVSDLIIHRLKVKTGLSGPVDYKIDITGIPDWTNTVSVTQPYEYNLNNVNMQASSTHVVPIFQRNKNLGIRIEGTTPFPVSLLGLDWEGKQNSGFYRRG